MAHYSRRFILKSGAAAAAIPFALWFDKVAKADPPMVRYSLASPQGAAMRVKYASAVATMFMKSAGDPCSWVSQWYTHAVKGMTNKAAEIAKLGPSAPKKLLAEIWDTCEAHHSGGVEDYFLPWHRMFVYFFERIVRKTVGDPSFTLPYWDYTDPTQRSVPHPFRDPPLNSNPLFRGMRDSNAGLPIDHDSSSPATSPINLDALKQTDYSDFNATLDGGLHGNVHVLVGNTHGMGFVPDACGDPLFWMHHCNIDRIWASWNLLGGTNPTSATWLNQKFVFVDENCNRVEGTIADFNDIAQLHYTYDNFVGERKNLKLPLDEYEIAILRIILLPPGPGPLHVQIPFSRPDESLRETVNQLKESSRVFLTVKGLEASAPVGTVFELFLGLPANVTRVPRGTPSVGAINFFDAVRMKGMERGAPGKLLKFDITEQIQTLARRDEGEKALPLTIQPMSKVNENAKAVIGEIRVSVRR